MILQGQDKRYYTVICGEHELNSKESHQVELQVTSVVTHPKWVTASQGYDIAVYKVRIHIKVVDIAKICFTFMQSASTRTDNYLFFWNKGGW